MSPAVNVTHVARATGAATASAVQMMVDGENQLGPDLVPVAAGVYQPVETRELPVTLFDVAASFSHGVKTVACLR